MEWKKRNVNVNAFFFSFIPLEIFFLDWKTWERNGRVKVSWHPFLSCLPKREKEEIGTVKGIWFEGLGLRIGRDQLQFAFLIRSQTNSLSLVLISIPFPFLSPLIRKELTGGKDTGIRDERWGWSIRAWSWPAAKRQQDTNANSLVTWRGTRWLANNQPTFKSQLSFLYPSPFPSQSVNSSRSELFWLDVNHLGERTFSLNVGSWRCCAATIRESNSLAVNSQTTFNGSWKWIGVGNQLLVQQ